MIELKLRAQEFRAIYELVREKRGKLLARKYGKKSELDKVQEEVDVLLELERRMAPVYIQSFDTPKEKALATIRVQTV